MPLDVLGIDHLYLSVSDLARSERFYDAVLSRLGFRKGEKPIANERHAHYVNRVMQLSLRPARLPGARHEPYAPGLHHLCLQVQDRASVDAAYAFLVELGIAATPPRLYLEYRNDYYATFFEDPDGIRLEIVSRGWTRDFMAARWEDLRAFRNPLVELAERTARGEPDPAAHGYRVRPARGDELAALPAIERAAAALFRDVGLAERFGAELTSVDDFAEAAAEGRLFLAVDAREVPVGFALVSEVGGCAHLDEVDVDPAHGRRGLGRALVEAAAAWGRARGLPALTLTTQTNVAWNAPLYERLGFRVLPPGEIGPALAALVEEEARRGLPMADRAVMRREL